MFGIDLSELKNFFETDVHRQSVADDYDYCFIFKYENNHVRPECQKIIELMKNAGLLLFSYLSVQKDELIVLVTAPPEVLRAYADSINFTMKLDKEQVQRLLLEGKKDESGENYIIKPISIPDDHQSRFKPYDSIYGEYRQSLPDDLYTDLSAWCQVAKNDDDKNIRTFQPNIRLKLLYGILTSPHSVGGLDIPINKFLLKKRILGFFPIHTDERNRLILKVQELGLFRFPTHEFKLYFGEKVALYFVFIFHIIKWTIFPALAGVAYQILVLASGDSSHDALPAYGLILCLWFVVMFEHWKRKEATNALQWGMTNYEQQENIRPEFKGLITKSFVNGEDTIYFPHSSYSFRIFQSSMVVASMMFLIVGVVVGIYIIRFSLQSSIGENASTIASILNTIQITVFNILYGDLAYFLTSRENHRTDTKFEDSLILKSFSFQFINSYSSFFFLAFIAQYLEKPSDIDDDSVVGQCGAETCMPSLTTNLAILFCTRIVVNNVIDIFSAFFAFQSKQKAERSNLAPNVVLTNPENDYIRNPFSIINENIKNYSDCAIQFGFSSLFVMALPCATFLNLISSAVKIRLTVYKYTKLYQRPILTGAQDIGTWMGIFNFITLASVTTNSALTFFSLDVFNKIELAPRIWLFMSFQWILIGIQLVIQYFVPDVPEDVELQIERTEFIVNKLIRGQPDEEMTNVAKFNRQGTTESVDILPEDPPKDLTCLESFSKCFPDCIFSKIQTNDRMKFRTNFNENFDYEIQNYQFNTNLPPSNHSFR